ncbi:hypothetical protein chiPu_0022043, partial [Chiloscyllium punctatum]|nr:hypothetical protein [Chiloscyllium punctatum]
SPSYEELSRGGISRRGIWRGAQRVGGVFVLLAQWKEAG